MSFSLSIPSLPIGKIVDWCGRNHDKNTQAYYETGSTLHQFHLYNFTANLTNVSLAITGAIVATAVYFSSPLGAALAIVPLYVHIRGASSCKERIEQNQDQNSGSLFGLNPERSHNWQRVSYEALAVLQWQNHLFKLSQEELDAFPDCFNEYFFNPSFPLSPSLIVQKEKFRSAWLSVHEKNRDYLRDFFSEELKKVSDGNRRTLLSGLFYTHLANLSPRLFFSEPQSEDAMERFLVLASSGKTLDPILEGDEQS